MMNLPCFNERLKYDNSGPIMIMALSTRLGQGAVMKLFQHESDANSALIPQLVLFAPIQH